MRKNNIERLFLELNEKNVGYVVIRKHDKLIDDIQDLDDIDILLSTSDFAKGISVIKGCGYSGKKAILDNMSSLFMQLIHNPNTVTKIVLRNPRYLTEVFNRALRNKPNKITNYRTQLSNNFITIDIMEHLAYSSTMTGEYIRVDPYIENKMIERRLKRDDIYIPSPPDELAHIICHVLFDKKGGFTRYYERRTSELANQVTESEEYNKQLEYLFDKLFFSASEYVYEKVLSGELDGLYENLMSYDSY